MDNKACSSVDLNNINLNESWSPQVADDLESGYSYQNFSERKKKSNKKQKKPFAKRALKCLGLTAMFVVIVSLGIAIAVKYGGKHIKSYGTPNHHHSTHPAKTVSPTSITVTYYNSTVMQEDTTTDVSHRTTPTTLESTGGT